VKKKQKLVESTTLSATGSMELLMSGVPRSWSRLDQHACVHMPAYISALIFTDRQIRKNIPLMFGTCFIKTISNRTAEEF
jgi:hypothetical protein